MKLSQSSKYIIKIFSLSSTTYREVFLDRRISVLQRLFQIDPNFSYWSSSPRWFDDFKRTSGYKIRELEMKEWNLNEIHHQIYLRWGSPEYSISSSAMNCNRLEEDNFESTDSTRCCVILDLARPANSTTSRAWNSSDLSQITIQLRV